MKESLLSLTLFLSSMVGIHGEPIVTDAWIRSSSGPNSALFMTIKNNEKTHDKLVAVDISPTICDHTELHAHIHEHGVMKMRQIPEIILPSGEQVELKPGGLHVMLMKLNGPLHMDMIIPVTLKFQNSKPIALNVPVKTN